jgi:hypothetical protein
MTLCLHGGFSGAVLGETIPKCKALYPNFRDLNDLNGLPGTIMEEEFQSKLALLRKQFSQLRRRQVHIFLEKNDIILRHVMEMNTSFQNEESETEKRRALLESQAASTLSLRKIEQDEDGPIARLYCIFASDLAIATYEQQQNHYYFKLGMRALQYVQGLN